ncbi:MAG: sulfatase-like hydrolase/transferase [Alphaproteobacteria bacterium]|nr:sulfatase-like hydrolase/transferase [Alphaproteobacteria bacterium]
MEAKNLLIIMSDEHDPRFMGASGHPFARTPNMDRLAARGTQFANAYTPCPICVPARASYATGRYVHEIGYWDNAIAYDGRVEGWGHRLQREGIRHDTIGKLHYRKEEDPLGIDEQHNAMHIIDGIGMVWGSIRDPLPTRTGLAGPKRLFRKIGPGVSNYNLYDRQCANDACNWLKRHADAEPWVLYVGFVAPHFPFVVPKHYLDLYPLDAIPFPKLLPRTGYQQHPWIKEAEAFVGQDPFFESDEQRLLAMAAYFGLCTFMDEQVGLVLDMLEDTGLADSTRVVYTSDHGDNLGARGLWGKSTLYEEATKIPMIVAGPDVPTGKVSETPVNLVDIYQTVLDGADLSPDDEEMTLPGRSLFELASGASEPERIAFSEYHAVGAPSAAFMLRMGHYKYHHYVGFPPELFDLETDPEELTDLAADPAHTATLAKCEAALRVMLDPDAIDKAAKADQAALIERFGGREAAMNFGAPGATPVPGQSQE